MVLLNDILFRPKNAISTAKLGKWFANNFLDFTRMPMHENAAGDRFGESLTASRGI